MNYRYEYKAIRNVLEEKYEKGKDFLLIPIEDINVMIDQDNINVLNGSEIIELSAVEKIFLVDLGKITLATLSYRVYILKYLESQGINVINSPETILICRNKLATYFLLKNKGLPILPVISVSNLDYADFFIELYPQPLLKPILGTMGIGITQLKVDKNKSKKIMDAYLLEKDVPLLQKFIRKKKNCDIRLLIVKNDVLAGMRRCTAKGKLTTNIAQGGWSTPLELTDEMCIIAVSAAKAIGGEIVTVDIVEDDETENLYILEINGFARWKGLQQVITFNIAEKIVEYVMG